MVEAAVWDGTVDVRSALSQRFTVLKCHLDHLCRQPVFGNLTGAVCVCVCVCFMPGLIQHTFNISKCPTICTGLFYRQILNRTQLAVMHIAHKNNMCCWKSGSSMMPKNQTESQNPVIINGICCIMWNVREFVKLWMNTGINFTNIPLFHLIKQSSDWTPKRTGLHYKPSKWKFGLTI